MLNMNKTGHRIDFCWDMLHAFVSSVDFSLKINVFKNNQLFE